MTAQPGMTVLPPLVAFHARGALSLGLSLSVEKYGRQCRHVPSRCHPSTNGTGRTAGDAVMFDSTCCHAGYRIPPQPGSAPLSLSLHDGNAAAGCRHAPVPNLGVA